MSIFSQFYQHISHIPLVQKTFLGILLAAPIGPVSIEVIKQGLRKGFRAAFIVCLGGAFGDATCMILGYTGISECLKNPAINSNFKLLVWTLGAFALGYLGIQNIASSFRQNFLEKIQNSHDKKNSFFAGYFLAIANPMSILFWLGVCGATVSAQNKGQFQEMLENLPILLGVIIWSIFLSSLLKFGKEFINEREIRLVNIISGICLVAFALSYGHSAYTEVKKSNMLTIKEQSSSLISETEN